MKIIRVEISIDDKPAISVTVDAGLMQSDANPKAYFLTEVGYAWDHLNDNAGWLKFFDSTA